MEADHGDQQRPGHEPADSHGRSARRACGPTRTRTSCRTAISRAPPKNGECAAMDNQTLGQQVFNREFDPARHRLGHPAVQLGLGATVQQEVAPRVSVNVGYFRNWWGNWYVVDNRATSLVGLHAVQHLGAGRSTAAGRRRARTSAASTISCRTRSGQVDELAQSSENFGEADRELARRGRQRRRAAADGAHGAGRHEHRAPARGRLRRAGDSCRSSEPGRRELQPVRHGERPVPRRRQSVGDEPVLPHRGAVQDAVQGARDLYDSRRWTSR